MRVLITGITGMAGSHLAEYCLSRGDVEVVGTIRWRSPRDNIAGIVGVQPVRSRNFVGSHSSSSTSDGRIRSGTGRTSTSTLAIDSRMSSISWIDSASPRPML